MTIEQLAEAIRRDPDFNELGVGRVSDEDVVRDTCTCPDCAFRLSDGEILDYADRAESLAQFDRWTRRAIKEQCDCRQPD